MAELNWRNPDDYAYLRTYDLHQWAWEFLRRNRDFRKAFAALESAVIKASAGKWELSHNEHKAFWDTHRAACEPWGLTLPADPRREFPEARVFFKIRAGVEILDSWKAPEYVPEEYAKWPGYPLVVALKFDLNYSVEVSIEIAAEQLRRFSRHLHDEFDYRPRAPKKARRFKRRYFELYVRLLDAELAGATIGKIGQALFSDKQDPRRSVTKTRATAHYMTKEGYRELLLLPPHSAPGLSGDAESPGED